jgi:ribose transport system ATP-binding protein
MPPILVLEKICKQYPGVVALDRVDLVVNAGEVRALVGKNGAGKSTLVKVLSGAVQPDSGSISIEGRPVVIHKPKDAFAQGISTVYQEMSLVPGLTVAENIFLGRWPSVRRAGIRLIDRQEILRLAHETLDQLQVDLDPGCLVATLSVAERQLVEIAKALSFHPRVLVLDEPTSALPAEEVETLHGVVRRLCTQGRAIIYVTHRLQEIPQVADTVTALRDGRHIGTIPVQDATPARIAQMMVGEDWQKTERWETAPPGKTVLSVRHLSRENAVRDVSFDLHEGEVLGIAGLLGSGRTELVRAIFGLDPFDAGEIVVGGRRINRPAPRLLKRHGVALTPEDRQRQGLVMIFSVRRNLTLACLKRIGVRGVLRMPREQALAREMVERLDIKTSGLDVIARTLSGGNQQKVVIGNWLNTQPKILIMDEPTRGIDIQAKEQIISLVRRLAADGMAVLFISSELEEVLNVTDRILIMVHGRVVTELARDETNLDQLLALVMEDSNNGSGIGCDH